MVRRVCRYGLTRPECLVRSIALQRMLSFHGVSGSRVRFGVRHREGTFESHAWVECGNQVIGEDLLHIRSFTPLEKLSISGPPPQY